MANRQQQALAAGNLQRVNGTSTETTVKSSDGILHTMQVSLPSGAASAQTLDIQNGASTVFVVELAAGDTVSLSFNARFDSGIRLNPSANNVDALVAYS